MQLDKTRIAIRERDMLETLDLTLHVIRAYAPQLLVTLALGIVPLMVVNQFLIGWMADLNRRDFDSLEYMSGLVRYLWAMALLVVIQAPLASVFATAYLGQAVFLDKPKIGQVVRDVYQTLPALIWCQCFVRAIVPATLCLMLLQRGGEFQPGTEILLLGGMALYAAVLRSLRPFMNEIILLERNPLQSPDPHAMTIGRRSAMLHGPAGGDLFLRWLGAAVVGVLLVVAFYQAFLFLQGIFLNDWTSGWLMLHICLPLCMWMVAGYMTVFRFLSYLDLRIRQEGWAVELRLRAEATRLQTSLSTKA